MEENNQKEMMTLSEAAKLISVHPETLRRWHLKEGLKTYKFKKTLRISKQDLLDFLSNRNGNTKKLG